MIPSTERPPEGRADRLALSYARFVVRRRWAVLVACLLLVAGAASGLVELVFTNSYRVFFDAGNPELLALDAIENTYTKNDNVMLVVTPANGNVFTHEGLALIAEITERAWQLPWSNRVDSVTNFQYTHADGDDLTVRDLVPEPTALTPQALADVRAVALSEPLLVGNLVALDGRVSAVNVTVQLPRRDERAEIPAVIDAARALARDIERSHPGARVRLTGVLVMDMAFSEASLHDARTLVAVAFTLIFALVGVLVGGVVGTLGTALVVGLAIATAMGLAGRLGYPVSPPIAAAPVIILTVGVANCVHLLESCLQALARGEDRDAALIEAIRVNFVPVFLASLTTVIGFLTFNFSDVPPFRQLGNIVAFGDLASYTLAMSLLPALLAVMPPALLAHGSRRTLLPAGWLHALAGWVIRRRRGLVLGLGAVSLLLVANLPRNVMNDVFVHYFDRSIAFRADTDYTIEHLTGLYHLHYALPAGESGGIADPRFLADVDAFAAWLRAQPEVRHVASFSDVMKRLNRNMHGDDPEAYRLPATRELAAQYLLLYEMSLPYGLDLNNQIDVDKSALKLSVAVRTLSSGDAIAFNERAETWLREHAPRIHDGYGTGTLMMFSHIGERNIRSMLGGSVLALVLISGVLLLSLRSFGLGLLSLVPNLLPIALGFGLWGLIDGEITLSLSVVASMTLGIVVDDTVHFLVKYRHARRAMHANPADALRHAYAACGRAMLVTSCVLVAGFLVLATSHFELNAGMGLLTAIVIVFAAIADLLLLGPLLLMLEKDADAPRNAA